MRLLDLFCGAGGAGAGYARAGFEVVGVDVRYQKNYPFEFHMADALTFPLRGFDVIHASPPCQRYSVASVQDGYGRARDVSTTDHPDQISRVRARLVRTGLPYVIENVPGAPLRDTVLLCGSMFGLKRLRRHRLFESNVSIPPLQCNHGIQRNCITIAGHSGGSSNRDGISRFGSVSVWREVMGINWMTSAELAEAIPPAYTEYIGRSIYRGGLK